MPEIIPVKTEKSGELKQYKSGDFTPVKFGGTGVTIFQPTKPIQPPISGMVVGHKQNALQLLRCVYDGKVDPTFLDSRKRGFSVGSRWVNVVEDTEWVCVDAKSDGVGAIWIQSSGGGTGPTDDTFRYYASLVDFEYDYQNYTWDDVNSNFNNEVFQIDYYVGGASGTYRARMRITYNVENQPTRITMNYISPSRPTKTLDFTYDNDGYFDTMTRT